MELHEFADALVTAGGQQKRCRKCWSIHLLTLSNLFDSIKYNPINSMLYVIHELLQTGYRTLQKKNYCYYRVSSCGVTENVEWLTNHDKATLNFFLHYCNAVPFLSDKRALKTLFSLWNLPPICFKHMVNVDCSDLQIPRVKSHEFIYLTVTYCYRTISEMSVSFWPVYCLPFNT